MEDNYTYGVLTRGFDITDADGNIVDAVEGIELPPDRDFNVGWDTAAIMADPIYCDQRDCKAFPRNPDNPKAGAYDDGCIMFQVVNGMGLCLAHTQQDGAVDHDMKNTVIKAVRD